MRARLPVTAGAIVVLSLAAVPAASADPVGGVVACPESRPSEPVPPWVEQLPRATATDVEVADTKIASPDGTLLAARLYRPTAFPGPLPTILIMSPYHGGSSQGMYFKEAEDAGVWDANCAVPFFLARGYAVVAADMRGTHNSGGCFDYGGRLDQQDGYAVVQWIARQAWSNGNVGMYGASHVGMSQYAAAVAAPPALKAIVPVAPITSFYRYLYSGGVPYDFNTASPAFYEYIVSAPPPTDIQSSDYVANVVATGCNTGQVLENLHPSRGDFNGYWKERDLSLLAGNIKAAVLHAHGTLDENVKMDHFSSMWRALEESDVERKAVVGPWAHRRPAVPNWDYIVLRWYEHWLRGNDTGMTTEPRATFLDQFGNQSTADTLGDRGTTLELVASNGRLVDEADRSSAAYQDVPGLTRPVVWRTPSVRLLYTSDPLSSGYRLRGSPEFLIHATIDKPSTHFAILAYDVAPSGARTYVTRGYLDARFRAGLTNATPVTPGVVERYRVELHAREYRFLPGHRIQVVLTSADYCGWTLFAECASAGVLPDLNAAHVTIVEGSGRSRLRLPGADTVR